MLDLDEGLCVVQYKEIQWRRWLLRSCVRSESKNQDEVCGTRSDAQDGTKTVMIVGQEDGAGERAPLWAGGRRCGDGPEELGRGPHRSTVLGRALVQQ